MIKRRSRTKQRPSERVHNLSVSNMRERSQLARDRGLHALAAMRHDPGLSLTHAGKLNGVKAETIKKYFPAALKKLKGKFRVAKSDRYRATLYVPDVDGNSIPVKTRSSREREELSKYLRDLGRYLRGKREVLAKWRGRKIGGVELVTAGRTIVDIEPALSDFSLYRAFNGGVA
jgi:hypothetical protein